jgi:hypothetical protein
MNEENTLAQTSRPLLDEEADDYRGTIVQYKGCHPKTDRRTVKVRITATKYQFLFH